MNQENKTIPTLETKPFESTCSSTADKKTLSPILKGIIIGSIVLVPIVLIGAAFVFVLFMFFVVVFIIRSNLNNRHEAQCFRNNSLHNKMVSPSPSLSDVYSGHNDLNPLIPGSAAWSMKQTIERSNK